MLDHIRLETLVGLGAASLLGYVLWGPKTTKTRTANAAGKCYNISSFMLMVTLYLVAIIFVTEKSIASDLIAFFYYLLLAYNCPAFFNISCFGKIYIWRGYCV